MRFPCKCVRMSVHNELTVEVYEFCIVVMYLTAMCAL